MIKYSTYMQSLRSIYIKSYTLYKLKKVQQNRLSKKTRFREIFQNTHAYNDEIHYLRCYCSTKKKLRSRKKRSLPLRHQFYLRFPSISPTTTDKPFYLASPSHVSRPIRTRKKKIWKKNGEMGEKEESVPRTRLHIALECLLLEISRFLRRDRF